MPAPGHRSIWQRLVGVSSMLIALCGLLLGTGGSVAAKDGPVSWQALGGPGGHIVLLAGPTKTGGPLYAVSATAVFRKDDESPVAPVRQPAPELRHLSQRRWRASLAGRHE